jgi:3-(3-hydroxy-phenyl)propionate hydroxylase
MKSPHVIIAGAGPVGVVAALACAQNDFRVTLLEAKATIDDNPRAATTHPSTLEMIARVGLIDQFIAEGLVARYFQFWDKATHTKITEFDHELLHGETEFPFVVQTEQHKLCNMGLKKLAQYGHVQVRMRTELTGLSQSDERVTVTAKGPNGTESIEGAYLIGADGGRSVVRKTLDIEFEGYTWPEQFLVLTVLDDFQQILPGSCYRNYMADPDEWTNLFKVTGDDGKGRWRAVCPTRPEETDDEALSDESACRRLQRIFPLHNGYNLAHKNLYKVHQRVAVKFRKGRVFLAGDSAHVNNTVGGLGLNGGLHDAMELVETLVSVERGGADAALFDRYERRRRTLNIEFVQEQTINNKKRLEEKDPGARQARFDKLRAISEDPKRHKQFLLRTSLIESVRKAKSIA